MANRRYTTQFLYQLETMPVLLSCNFVVDPTNTNGLGISSLKGPGISKVFMHTSATPAGGNPNPENGVIMVQLQDTYSRVLSLSGSAVSYLDGSSQTSTTAGRASVITALGTATLAQWQAKGLPAGITPAVGVCFIATATGAIGGSAAVQRPLASGISAIERCGTPNLTLNPSLSSVNGGGIIILETLAPSAAAPTLTMASYTPAGTNDSATPPIFTGTPAVLTGTVSAPAMTLVRTAPVAGSIISLSILLSNSSNTVQGQ